MKKTKIPWAEMGWDLTTGCKHNCKDLSGKSYCYIHRYMPDPLNPRWFPDRLEEPKKMKTPSIIFTSPSGDIMGDWIPIDFLYDMFRMMNNCPQHIFLILTKNPKRYLEFSERLFTPNIWIGASITRSTDAHRVISLRNAQTNKTFISFEPMLEYLTHNNYSGIKWAIIGARTDHNSYTAVNLQDSQNYARHLIGNLREFKIPIFIKPNLEWKPKTTQFPMEIENWKVLRTRDNILNQPDLFGDEK